MDHDIDRPRGILSPADRSFLLGETEMTHEQSRRNAAARVRERVDHGIRDFTLLAHTLSERDRRGVFEAVDDDAFVDGLTAMLSFAYLGLREQGVDFERVLEPAIRTAEEVYAAETLGSAVEVGVGLDVTTEYGTAIDEAAERIHRDRAVTPEELFSVVMADDPVLEEVATIVVQLPRDADTDGGVVRRLARYLDATVTERPHNRVELRLE
ncbi:MAG: hypothetical protein ABEJ89_01850 [Haloarculaceae archaeon]